MKISSIGPHTKQVSDCLKELKVEYDTYFGGTALVGNMVHKIFNDFRDNPKPILLRSLESDSDLYNRFLAQWKILTDCDTYFSVKDPTKEDIKKLIVACELFCKQFPKNFPTKNITRKMDCLSLILPLIIKEKGSNLYKYLKMEQEGERIHQRIKKLDQKYTNVRDKTERYYLIIRDLENENNTDLTDFQRKKRNFRKIRDM